MNFRYLGQFESKGALEPLAPYLAGSDAFAQEDFYPEAMSAFQFDGEQVCMPQNVSSLVLYYNRDLFEQAGVPLPPEEGWSWNDMVAAATELTQDADGDGASTCTGSASTRRSSAWRRSSGPTAARSSTIPVAPTRSAIGSLRGDPGGAGLPRSAGGRGGDPDRRGGGVPKLRGAVPRRHARDDDGVAQGGAVVPHDHRLRVGRRAAARAPPAGDDPALRRLLHDRGERPQGPGLDVPRVRARTRGPERSRRPPGGPCRRCDRSRSPMRSSTPRRRRRARRCSSTTSPSSEPCRTSRRGPRSRTS